MAHSRGRLGSDGALHQTTLRLGVLGTDVAEHLQSGIHALGGVDEPHGWSHQISDGGEPTAQYTRERRSLLMTRNWSGGTQAEFSFGRGLSLGYITEVTTGLAVRWGRLNSQWWGFQPDPSVHDAQPGLLAPRSREWYFWMATQARLRAYNALLQGQFRDSTVTYGYGELNHVLGDVSLGFTRQITDSARLSYVLRFQSSEVESGPGNRYLLWGGLTLSVDL